jgi:diacylglycerol kinase family enzyme
LVANPTAQSGRARRWIGETKQAMEAHGLSVETLETVPDRGTIALVTDKLNHDDAIDVVVYLGGDGTFHEVATGILNARRKRPLGMQPAGTANDQGLSFGIERGEIERNVAVIAAGHLTQLDVGRIERLDHAGATLAESYFFDSCGWGLNPDILVLRNRQRAQVARIPLLRHIYRDKAIYIASSVGKLLQSYTEVIKFACDVVADGERHHLKGLTDIIISGTPVYAGHWVLDRHAEPDDGKFELAPMQGRRDWASKTLRDLAASPIWQEQLDHFGLTHSAGFTASCYELDFYHPERAGLTAQVDGEEWGRGDRYRVQVLPNVLPLITPSNFSAPWKR